MLKKSQAGLDSVEAAQAANLQKRSMYRHQMFDALALGGALYKAVKPAVDF